MNYPTLAQVESADREQIYRWYMLLPVPRLVKDKKTKTWVMEPVNGQETMNRIVSRWKEFGGTDRTIADKIFGEVYAPIRST